MPDAFISPPILLAFAQVSTAIGLAWLALAKDAHWQQLRGRQPLSAAVAQTLRVLGSIALLASLVLCLLADRPSMAVLVWIMGLATSALVVTFAFTWRPHLFAPLIAWVRRS